MEKTKTMRHWIGRAIVVLALSGSALAQVYEEPAAGTMNERSTTWEWLYAGVFLVGCLVVAFKPAKRANMR